MDSQPALKFNRILNEVRGRFSFLFHRGFRIISAIYVDDKNECLQVMLLSQDYLINILCDGSQIDLGLSTLDLYDTVGFLDIRQMINLIQGRQRVNPLQNFEKTAQLMERYMDEILLRLTQIQCCEAANENGLLPWSNSPFFISTGRLFAYFTIDHITVI